MCIFKLVLFKLVLACAALVTTAWLGSRALATGEPASVATPPLTGPGWTERGVWRTRVQQVFDVRTHELVRRVYTVWDAAPSRDLDFVWTLDNPGVDRPGRINGSGHLVWRIKGRPTYDPTAVHAEYRGSFRRGRAEGHGAWLDHAGLYYEGEWRGGLMHGHGTLKLPGGDEYVGQMRSGRANGVGRVIDSTGEVYEGPFVDGHRHGRGKTTLPGGHTYASLWVMGREAEATRLVRVAQGGAKSIVGGDDIRIGITIDKRLPPSSRKEEKALNRGDLWYAVSNTPSGLQIRPDNKRLMSVWKGGGDIHLTGDEQDKNLDDFGVFSLLKGQLVPLSLNIELQNRASRPVRVVGAYLDVASSETDLQPAIQMAGESAFAEGQHGHYYMPFRYIENFGWGTARNARLRVKFTATGQPSTAPTTTLDLGTIEKSTRVDFEPTLRAAGVNVDILRQNSSQEDDQNGGFRCKSRVLQACQQELRALRIFGTLAPLVTLSERDGALEAMIRVGLAGSLDYEWADSKGQTQQASAPFKTTLALGYVKRPYLGGGEGEGASREIIAVNAAALVLDRTAYRVPVAFRTETAAGRTSRLTLPIEAEKASAHAFTVVVQLDDGREIRSRQIDLLYFTPRWQQSSSYQPQTSRGSLEQDWQLFTNHDLGGTELRRLKTDGEWECAEVCGKDAACSAATYEAQRSSCSLRRTVGQLRLEPRFTTVVKKALPAPARSTAASVITMSSGKAMSGFGYMILPGVSLDECSQRCTAEQKCVAFTYRRAAQTCNLAEEVKDLTNAADAQTGVRRQPPP